MFRSFQIISVMAAATTPCLQKLTSREYIITLARKDETP